MTFGTAAAQSASCQYLLSEDRQDGQTFDDLQVVNPFLHEPRIGTLSGFV